MEKDLPENNDANMTEEQTQESINDSAKFMHIYIKMAQEGDKIASSLVTLAGRILQTIHLDLYSDKVNTPHDFINSQISALKESIEELTTIALTFKKKLN